MSYQTWQQGLTSAGIDLIAANSIPTPNKVVIQNTNPRFTVFVAAGTSVSSAPNLNWIGVDGGTTENCIVIPPGATSPVITLVSGAGLWAASDAPLGWAAGINVIQDA